MSQNRCRRDRIGGQKPARSAGGFTRGTEGRQPNAGCFERTVLGSKNEPAIAAPILSAMTVHFPFQNTYAALPANFFARVAPTPVAAPRLIKLNRPLAVQLGLDPDLLETPGRRRNPRRQDAARRRRADRDGLCRPPVRAFRAPARRRPRHPARRGHRQGRRPPRHPAQGLRPHARSRAAATAAPRSGRCCANTSSARPCSRSAFRPRARSPPSSPARA